MADKTVEDILEQDNSYAQYLADRMIDRLVKTVPQNSKLAYQICAGFENHFFDVMDIVGIKFPDKKKKQGKMVYGATAKGSAVNKTDWENIQKFVAGQVGIDQPEEDIFTRNVRSVQSHLGLTDIECDALIMLHAIQTSDPSYRGFIRDLINEAPDRFPAFLAIALGKKGAIGEISKAVGPRGKLAAYGLIDYFDEHGASDDFSVPVVEDVIKDVLSAPVFDYERVTEEIVGKPAVAELTIDGNFRHLRKKAKKIAGIIKEAKAKGVKGINIVIHGPAGGGKTELAKAIAAEAGFAAYLIGEDEASNMRYGDGDSDNARIDSMKRLSSLRRAQAFLDPTQDVLTVMDEMEDLLVKGEDTQKAADTGSKILLNRTLEENEIPTIWIGNDVADKFHASVRQRFKIVVQVGYQPTVIREDIWRYHLEKNGLSLSDGEVLNLARKYEAPPRVIAHACEVASLSTKDYAALCEQVEDKAALERGGHRSGFDTSFPVPADYDLDLINADVDLEKVISDFKEASENDQAPCLLIEGDRKVGKSSFAHYLAEASTRHVVSFDMDTLVRPTNQSDPVDHISMAFNEAAKADAILVIEELDLLFTFAAKEDRAKMVARFMDHMDTHQAPVVLINSGDAKDIPDDFRAFVDQEIKLDKVEGEQLDKAAKIFLGRKMPEGQNTPTAIGALTTAARSFARSGAPANDGAVKRRIAASATIAAADRGPGY